MKELIKEYEKWNVYKERNFIKPFNNLVEVWKLLHNDDFISKINDDKKFFMFIRKKLFWILDNNEENDYLLFKAFPEGETNDRLISISDQVLLIYFEENLSFADLCGISFRNDEHNSIVSYSINSKRGLDTKAPLN